jgi:hypothetical protein
VCIYIIFCLIELVLWHIPAMVFNSWCYDITLNYFFNDKVVLMASIKNGVSMLLYCSLM